METGPDTDSTLTHVQECSDASDLKARGDRHLFADLSGFVLHADINTEKKLRPAKTPCDKCCKCLVFPGGLCSDDKLMVAMTALESLEFEAAKETLYKSEFQSGQQSKLCCTCRGPCIHGCHAKSDRAHTGDGMLADPMG